jgi:ribonuclease P protein component
LKIEKTYREGVVVKAFPFFSKFTLNHADAMSLQIVFVVPKKKFRLATTRNRIRRYIRESVRLEKNPLEDMLRSRKFQMALFLAYNGEENLTLADTQKLIGKLFKKIIHEVENQ